MEPCRPLSIGGIWIAVIFLLLQILIIVLISAKIKFKKKLLKLTIAYVISEVIFFIISYLIYIWIMGQAFPKLSILQIIAYYLFDIPLLQDYCLNPKLF